MKKKLFAAIIAFVAITQTAAARVHRVVVDLTVQRCTAFSCRVYRTTWEATCLAIGRKNGAEYVLTCAHVFAGGDYGTHKITVRKINGITIKTSDAGNFSAVKVATLDTKGKGGADLALLRIDRPGGEWNAWTILDGSSTDRGLPAGGSRVVVKGFPLGRRTARDATVSGYRSEYGMKTTGVAKSGMSGGAIQYNDRLAGIVWGSQYGHGNYGTFATHGVTIAKFVRGELGSIPGSSRGGSAASVKRSTGSSSSGKAETVIGSPSRSVGPRVNDGWKPVSRKCDKCSAEFARLRNRLEAFYKIREGDLGALEKQLAALRKRLDNHKPTDVSMIVEMVNRLAVKVSALEKRKIPGPVDVSGLKKDIAALGVLITKESQARYRDVSMIRDHSMKTASQLKSLTIPVRIETSEGKLIREKRYKIIEKADGTLELKPIVLKFDEKILTGSSPE